MQPLSDAGVTEHMSAPQCGGMMWNLLKTDCAWAVIMMFTVKSNTPLPTTPPFGGETHCLVMHPMYPVLPDHVSMSCNLTHCGYSYKGA